MTALVPRRDTSRVATPLDREIWQAEAAAYRHYGLHPYEERVWVDSIYGHYGVRLTRFRAHSSSGRPLPPVLLLHGIGSVNVIAAPLLAHLSGREVVAVDFPGHGLSQRCILPRQVDLRGFTGSVVESLLAHVGADQVDLVGHSLGAQFSLYAGLDLADRVRRLVLLGAPGAAFPGAKPVAAMKLMTLPWVGKLAASVPMDDQKFALFNEQYALGRDAFVAVPPHMITAGRLINGRSGNAESVSSYYRALLRRGSIRPEVTLSAIELGRLRQPTLLAWGDNDIFSSPARAAESVVAIRDAHLIRVPGAGHAPWLQRPQVVGSAVAAHLA
jgi:pimeloyl-ACP methyl ester carboxylesterase